MINTKTWECPECGQLYVTPPDIYQAVCSCPGLANLTAVSAAISAARPVPVMLRTVNMIDITSDLPRRPGEWVLRAVPEDMASLL